MHQINENENSLDMPNDNEVSKIPIETNNKPIDTKASKAEQITKGLFFTFITFSGVALGFATSLGSTKKNNSKLVKNKKNIHYLHASGADLAQKALLRATAITVTGFSVFCFSIWKLSGAENFTDFRYKIGNILPRISNKNKEKEGRRDFENLTELWHFLIEEDNKKRK